LPHRSWPESPDDPAIRSLSTALMPDPGNDANVACGSQKAGYHPSGTDPAVGAEEKCPETATRRWWLPTSLRWAVRQTPDPGELIPRCHSRTRRAQQSNVRVWTTMRSIDQRSPASLGSDPEPTMALTCVRQPRHYSERKRSPQPTTPGSSRARALEAQRLGRLAITLSSLPPCSQPGPICQVPTRSDGTRVERLFHLHPGRIRASRCQPPESLAPGGRGLGGGGALASKPRPVLLPGRLRAARKAARSVVWRGSVEHTPYSIWITRSL